MNFLLKVAPNWKGVSSPGFIEMISGSWKPLLLPQTIIRLLFVIYLQRLLTKIGRHEKSI
jgi:hypothetical protein